MDKSQTKIEGRLRIGTRLIEFPNAPGADSRRYKIVAKFKIKGTTMFTLARWMPRGRWYGFKTESETMLRTFWARPAKTR